MAGALAVILAAGKSTRMKSALPKVLHEVCGRAMIDYVVDAARAAGVGKIVAVVGHRADLVQGYLSRTPGIEFALQSEQKGTGHAVMMCREQLAAHHGPVLILAGDTPLLKAESLAALLTAQREQSAAAVIGTATTAANHGLGRIVRAAGGNFLRIVEEKDASPDEKQIQEINTGCYAFDSQSLLGALEQIRPDNSQAEYYLTDCPRILLQSGKPVVALNAFDLVEAQGVNTRVQLADVTASIQAETLAKLMASGVTIVSPPNTIIDPRAIIEPDTVIHPFTVISGAVRIGSDCVIGPHAVISGAVTLPAGTTVGAFQELRVES
ncbi:NTP transferase domain-containing protein [Planctellipticum variicoloris]|uniref:NTP transferase domain-containing protein n=1 Tax=Planctellipticum variicoloris TaxID=3064265 RepID=UPI00301359EC|nr:NTP transferase domain-containing protein [Planctomycetaceae bacterium SH412]